MAEKKASMTTKEMFDGHYRKDAMTGQIEIELGDDSFYVDTEPNKDGRYCATACYETDTYSSTDYFGDTSDEALVHALRAALYRYQTRAYMFAEIIDMLGYDELAEVDDD